MGQAQITDESRLARRFQKSGGKAQSVMTPLQPPIRMKLRSCIARHGPLERASLAAVLLLGLFPRAASGQG
jgi:hypothetical protein